MPHLKYCSSRLQTREQGALTRNSKRLGRDLKPGKLESHLELGITEVAVQDGGKHSFNGKESNIHFHHVDGIKSLAALSGSPCETKGSYLAWSDMTFKRSVPGVFKMGDEKKEVVRDVLSLFYNIILPVKTTWSPADHLCRVLGGGMMMEVEDDQTLRDSL